MSSNVKSLIQKFDTQPDIDVVNIKAASRSLMAAFWTASAMKRSAKRRRVLSIILLMIAHISLFLTVVLVVVKEREDLLHSSFWASFIVR